MAETEPFLLQEAFPGLKLALPLPTQRYQNGDVIIKLSERREDQLLVHKSVLAAASGRFRARFRNTSVSGGRKIVDSKTMEEFTVLTYKLVCIDDTLCLTDEGDSAPLQQISVRSSCLLFQYSDLASGFGHCGEAVDLASVDNFHQASIEAHKLIFALLYKLPIGIENLETGTEIFILTEATALAEYYQILPAIAGRLTALLEDVPSLWMAISKGPEYYLRLSTKLRATNIFFDALRHFTGQLVAHRINYPSALLWQVDPAVTNIICEKQKLLHDRMEILTRELRELSLSWYQASSWKVKRHRGPEVRTTCLSDGKAKNLSSVCRWVATSVYRETLDQKIYGEAHWSHVRFGETTRRDGEVDGGSLPIACKAVFRASEEPDSMDIFGKNAARRFARILNLPRHPSSNSANMIAGQLKALVRNAKKSIEFWFPSEDNYRNLIDSMYWSRAKHDSKLDYFTFLPIQEQDDIPWSEQGSWKEPDLNIVLEPADDESLQLLGWHAG